MLTPKKHGPCRFLVQRKETFHLSPSVVDMRLSRLSGQGRLMELYEQRNMEWVFRTYHDSNALKCKTRT